MAKKVLRFLLLLFSALNIGFYFMACLIFFPLLSTSVVRLCAFVRFARETKSAKSFWFVGDGFVVVGVVVPCSRHKLRVHIFFRDFFAVFIFYGIVICTHIHSNFFVVSACAFFLASRWYVIYSKVFGGFFVLVSSISRPYDVCSLFYVCVPLIVARMPCALCCAVFSLFSLRCAHITAFWA